MHFFGDFLKISNIPDFKFVELFGIFSAFAEKIEL
jgi:hypothetical protein